MPGVYGCAVVGPDPQNIPIEQRGAAIADFYSVGVVDTLQPYLGDAGNKPFECPAAKGAFECAGSG